MQKRRAVLAALCVALLVCATLPARAQSSGLRGVETLSDAIQPRVRGRSGSRGVEAPPAAAQPPAPLRDSAPPPDRAAPTTFREDFPDQPSPRAGVANYGPPRRPQRLPRPYPPRRVYTPAPFSPRLPLPPLEPYKTSYQAKRLAKLRGTTQPDPAAPPPPTVAVEPTIKVKPIRKPEDRPYDPVGIGIGSLRLRPFVEVSGGYDDNPNRLSSAIRDRRPSAVFRGEGGFDLQSEWSRHNLTANLRGGYSEYFAFREASRPDATGNLSARYDVTRDTSLDLDGRLALDTIRPGSPAISAGVATVTSNRPVTIGLNLTPGITHRFNRLNVSLRGTYDRVFFNDVFNSDGTRLDLARTSYNGFGGGGRVSYELTPDLRPFVEGFFDRRVHDSPTDFNGFFRDSDGFNVRGGAQINLTELLKGEASGGYAERTYDDPRLPKLRGPTVDASLIYTPSALTTVTLRGATTLNETTLANAAGALTRSVSAQISHDLMRNLNVTALGSYYENDYQGADIKERGYTAGVRLDYRVTRSVSLRGSYIHEQLGSSFPNADYTANVFLVGLRFQL